MESSIEEDVEGEKVEKETLDTTVYPPDYITEVNYQDCFKFTYSIQQLFNNIDWEKCKEKKVELGNR